MTGVSSRVRAERPHSDRRYGYVIREIRRAGQSGEVVVCLTKTIVAGRLFVIPPGRRYVGIRKLEGGGRPVVEQPEAYSD